MLATNCFDMSPEQQPAGRQKSWQKKVTQRDVGNSGKRRKAQKQRYGSTWLTKHSVFRPVRLSCCPRNHVALQNFSRHMGSLNGARFSECLLSMVTSHNLRDAISSRQTMVMSDSFLHYRLSSKNIVSPVNLPPACR